MSGVGFVCSAKVRYMWDMHVDMYTYSSEGQDISATSYSKYTHVLKCLLHGGYCHGRVHTTAPLPKLWPGFRMPTRALKLAGCMYIYIHVYIYIRMAVKGTLAHHNTEPLPQNACLCELEHGCLCGAVYHSGPVDRSGGVRVCMSLSGIRFVSLAKPGPSRPNLPVECVCKPSRDRALLPVRSVVHAQLVD